MFITSMVLVMLYGGLMVS